MNEGKYVFAQIASYIPRFQFDRIVDKYRGNYRAHEQTCYNQFLHLLFGQSQNTEPVHYHGSRHAAIRIRV